MIKHQPSLVGKNITDVALDTLTRRKFITIGAVAATALSGCARPIAYTPPLPTRIIPDIIPSIEINRSDFYDEVYGEKLDELFPLPAIPYYDINPSFLRQEVFDPTGEPPGTIVVDTSEYFLYLVLENQRAMRYGVGIGREGFSWSGRAVIHWKRKWPTWTPPEEMIERQPELEIWSVDNGGMPPGLKNPLGARALYVFQDKKDTLYRLHGSPEYNSIGKSISSGCVRLMNQDICDLYDRAPHKAPLLVVQYLNS